MRLSATIANSLWVAAGIPAWRTFCAAVGKPAEAQLIWLRRHLARNAECEFAREHRLGAIRSYKEFSHTVPLMDYEQIEPWIQRIQRGEGNVLSRERITHLIPTSGSSGARKLIPFTSEAQHDFNRAIGPWICDLARQHPAILGGPAYWCITPPVDQGSKGNSVVPIGFADDASYLGGVKGWLVRAALVSPPSMSANQSLEEFQFQTLRSLLRERELGLVSIWHASFLSLLLDALPQHWDRLLAGLPEAGRLQEIGPHEPEKLWPRLRVVSCWGDAHARVALADLQRRLPHTHVQSKGLLATEAFVTIPFRGGHPVAVRSHFFEFKDETGRLRLVEELRENETYEVVVTTSGGLWRYRLGDLVQVKGWIGETPSLEFLGRGASVSDLSGEKLTEPFVAAVIREAVKCISASLRFVMLAPADDSPSRYVLHVEGAGASELAARVEELLRRNPHYDLCRRLGQLQAVELNLIRGGYDAFVAHELSKGKRLGEIKPVALYASRPLRFPSQDRYPVATGRGGSAPASRG